MILIVRQYNLQSTRYIFPQLDKTSDFKLDLSVLDDNPPPYSTSPVRNERLLILIPSRSSVAPNKVSSYCLHASPRSRLQVPAGGASQANCWGRCVRVLCPLSSPRDRYLDVTPRWSPEIGHISLGAPPPSQTHEQGVIVINGATNCKWLL